MTDIERFKFIEISNTDGVIKIYDSSSGKDLTEFTSEFLEIPNKPTSFREDEFVDFVLPALKENFHDYANKATIFLYQKS